MLNLISNWRRERAATSQLSRLSDRALDDLGIQRRDIKAVARFASTASREVVASSVASPFAFADLGAGLRIETANASYRPTSLAA